MTRRKPTEKPENKPNEDGTVALEFSDRPAEFEFWANAYHCWFDKQSDVFQIQFVNRHGQSGILDTCSVVLSLDAVDQKEINIKYAEKLIKDGVASRRFDGQLPDRVPGKTRGFFLANAMLLATRERISDSTFYNVTARQMRPGTGNTKQPVAIHASLLIRSPVNLQTHLLHNIYKHENEE